MTQFYTSIRPELKRTVLLRGSLLAIVGGLIIVSAGIFIPADLLQYTGLPLLLLGGTLIALGLVPHRRLTRLEASPHKVLIEKGALHYLVGGRPTLQVALNDIERIAYRDKSLSDYGIEILLKGDSEVYFFPYFSKTAFINLTEECRAS